MNLSDKINLLTAIATAVATFATCFVSYLTIGIAKATRQAAELNYEQLQAGLRPQIHVSVMPRLSVNVMDLKITNAGPSSAMNLRLTLDKPFHFNGQEGSGSNIQDKLPNLIESFPPGTSLTFMLGAGFSILENSARCPQQFSVRAAYFHRGERFVEETLMDLSAFLGSNIAPDPIPDELKELRKEVETFRKLIDRRFPPPQPKAPKEPVTSPSRIRVSRKRR